MLGQPQSSTPAVPFRLVHLLGHRDSSPRGLVPLASLALAAGGLDHLWLYQHGYRAIPVIGRLFAANVAASAVIAGLVLFRRELVVRLAGLGVAAGTATEQPRRAVKYAVIA